MKLSHIWTMATKDMGILIRKKYLFYATIIIPIGLSIGLPVLIKYVLNKRDTRIQLITPLFDAFSFLYIILAGVIPLTLAAYSFVGEKVEKTLEPLLATPTTDGELLFGKFLAAFIPCICMLYISGGIFMVLMNAVTSGKLGYNYFPNTVFYLIMFLVVPLTSIFSVEFSIIISSRVTDVRSAQQLSYLALIPMLILYIFIEVKAFTLDTVALFWIGIIIGLIDLILFFISKSLFAREEILTRWGTKKEKKRKNIE